SIGSHKAQLPGPFWSRPKSSLSRTHVEAPRVPGPNYLDVASVRSQIFGARQTDASVCSIFCCAYSGPHPALTTVRRRTFPPVLSYPAQVVTRSTRMSIFGDIVSKIFRPGTPAQPPGSAAPAAPASTRSASSAPEVPQPGAAQSPVDVEVVL